MSIFLQNALLWTLALYGLFEIIRTIMIYFSTYKGKKSKGIYIIIAVRNEEENIEGFIRSMVFKILYGKDESIKQIIVLDLNSEDKTQEILQKLSDDYECINYMNLEEVSKFYKNALQKNVL